MASHESSVQRPSSRSHVLRSSPATSIPSLIALLMMMLALIDTNQVSASFQPSNYDINIGAFNIQKFGLAKTKNREVMMEIARIVTQFDIIAIQEILNNSDVASLLLDYVRQCNCSEEQSCLYDHKISEPLGRSFVRSGNTFKDYAKQAVVSGQTERYGFFYRNDTLQIVETYQYKREPFIRPPFAAHVKLRNFNAVPEFLFIVVHVQPSNAAEEINSLRRVYSYFRQRSGISNVIIGGDLNAATPYWNEKQNTVLTEKCGFNWLINSNVYTNIAESKPYDRFIINAKELWQNIRNKSADAYKYVISGDIERSNISDHYPIGMRLSVRNQLKRSSPTCPTRPVQTTRYWLRPRPTKRYLDET